VISALASAQKISSNAFSSSSSDLGAAYAGSSPSAQRIPSRASGTRSTMPIPDPTPPG
jgi:hypothetical protein